MVRVPPAPTPFRLRFYKENAGALRGAALFSAVYGVAKGMTRIADEMGCEAIENPENNPQDSLEIIRYLQANRKVPKESQARLKQLTAYWESRANKKIRDVETPGLCEGVKAIPVVVRKFRNVDWREVWAAMPSAMWETIKEQFGVSTKPETPETAADIRDRTFERTYLGDGLGL